MSTNLLRDVNRDTCWSFSSLIAKSRQSIHQSMNQENAFTGEASCCRDFKVGHLEKKQARQKGVWKRKGKVCSMQALPAIFATAWARCTWQGRSCGVWACNLINQLPHLVSSPCSSLYQQTFSGCLRELQLDRKSHGAADLI